MASKLSTNGIFLTIVLVITISVSVEGAWKNLIGSWSDSGSSWTGSIPNGIWHYGPARLWTTKLNTDQYVITSRVKVSSKKACGHTFKYQAGSVATSSKVTKAWGYFLWDGYLYITSSGPESSPRINFGVSNAWHKLKSVVNGTNVKIYVDDKLAKEITMSGSGADAKSNNYVGIWCHYRATFKGNSFQFQVTNCPAPSLGRLVETSPKSCLTSKVNINTNCSFSCSQGYQIGITNR